MFGENALLPQGRLWADEGAGPAGEFSRIHTLTAALIEWQRKHYTAHVAGRAGDIDTRSLTTATIVCPRPKAPFRKVWSGETGLQPG